MPVDSVGFRGEWRFLGVDPLVEYPNFASFSRLFCSDSSPVRGRARGLEVHKVCCGCRLFVICLFRVRSSSSPAPSRATVRRPPHRSCALVKVPPLFPAHRASAGFCAYLSCRCARNRLVCFVVSFLMRRVREFLDCCERRFLVLAGGEVCLLWSCSWCWSSFR